MIALVEGASRQKTPNEIALDILISGMTLILLVAVVTLQPFAVYDKAIHPPPCSCAVRLPGPDDDRRPAVGDRHRRHGPDVQQTSSHTSSDRPSCAIHCAMARHRNALPAYAISPPGKVAR